jgi:hypothetical protein
MNNRVKRSGCRYPVCVGMEVDPIHILAPQCCRFPLGLYGGDYLDGSVIYADIHQRITGNKGISFVPVSETGSDMHKQGGRISFG